jgi:hypothetical protein
MCFYLPVLNYGGALIIGATSPFNKLTEQVSVAVALLTRIQELFDLILSRTPAVLIDIFHDFPLSLQANVEIIPRIGHDNFHTNSSQLVHRPPFRLYGLVTKSGVKFILSLLSTEM